MIYVAKIRLKEPALGDRKTNRNVFSFPRNKGGEWDTDYGVWWGRFCNARENTGIDFDPESIRMPMSILLPRTNLFERRYEVMGGPRGPGRVGKCLHEMIPRNCILTFKFATMDYDGRKKLKVPDQGELDRIFTMVGAYDGISPFGRERGFGRFTVEEIDRDA